MHKEFSRSFHITDLPKEGKTVSIQANPEECIAIARRANVPMVQKFEAKLELKYLPHSDILQVKGIIHADYYQICVLSLEQFPQNSHFAFESECVEEEKFQLHNSVGPDDTPSEPREDYEPIVDGYIDLGELTVQQFMINLDPYPKKPGVDVDAWKESIPAAPKPFAILGELRKK